MHFLTHLKLAWYGLALLCMLIMILLGTLNSKALLSVSIKVQEGQTEHRDQKVPLITKKGEELPDYRLEYWSENEWHVIGTAFNTSASDWLEFKISDPPI